MFVQILFVLFLLLFVFNVYTRIFVPHTEAIILQNFAKAVVFHIRCVCCQSGGNVICAGWQVIPHGM